MREKGEEMKEATGAQCHEDIWAATQGGPGCPHERQEAGESTGRLQPLSD